ncbi:HDOD domain-containing protein [Nitrospirales bacterium NOB]|nr:HDOD domain-containing protein [Nitrospirales bacterium NOB]
MCKMKQILFVDDEPRVLEGLRRMLRPMRDEWNMTFVTSGPDALDMLAQAPFEVVVSDMRMPGMDGAQLLNEVHRRYPHIVRIVLSGQSDQVLIYRSIEATHQYLGKPCDADILKQMVMRACALREALASDTLRAVVAGMQQIPSRPSLYDEIRKEAASEHASLKTLGAIISKDMGMTAKILQLANSAYFGLRRNVTTPEQAVNMLGLDTIQALVLTVQVFSSFPSGGDSFISMDRLWTESLEAGALARAIAKAEQASAVMADQAYIAGLLHDVGTLVFVANVREQYNAAFSAAHDKNLTLSELERQEFGATHAEIGAHLLRLWGLVDPIVEAVAFHHCPGECIGETFSPLTAVHVANALLREQSAQGGANMQSEIDLAYLDKLHMTDRLEYWREVASTVQREGKKESKHG